MCKTELNAVLIETLLIIIVGMFFAGSSVVWDIDEWNLIKQTLVYFFINLIPVLVLYWFNNMKTFTVKSFIISYLVYTFIFVGIWIFKYLSHRKSVNDINQGLKKYRN